MDGTLDSFTEVIRLGFSLQKYFADSKLAVHPELEFAKGLNGLMSPGVATVHGSLNLSHHEIVSSVSVQCRFTIKRNWRASPPTLRCTEPWLRRQGGRLTTDWHIFDDGALCYTFPIQWLEQLAAIESKYGTEAATASAGFVAINSSRWLLYRHLQGYREQLVDWPVEWPQWPHHELAIQEYRRSRQRSLN